MVHMSQVDTLRPSLGLQSAPTQGPIDLKSLNTLLEQHRTSSALRATDAANAMVEQLVSDLGYDDQTLDSTSIARSLPKALRTNHWYCDLHHSMFLILLSRADDALAEDRRGVCENYIDTLTIYWILHSLMEEEGMALQIQHDRASLEQSSAHARSHVLITRWWRANVLEPFKTQSSDNQHMRRALRAFFKQVVNHITTMDQECYGVNSSLDERDITREVAHIAQSGLPLSPFMPGCTDILETLAPRMRTSLNPQAITPMAKKPMKPLHLVQAETPLWSGDKGAFRDVLSRQDQNRRLYSA